MCTDNLTRVEKCVLQATFRSEKSTVAPNTCRVLSEGTKTFRSELLRGCIILSHPCSTCCKTTRHNRSHCECGLFAFLKQQAPVGKKRILHNNICTQMLHPFFLFRPLWWRFGEFLCSNMFGRTHIKNQTGNRCTYGNRITYDGKQYRVQGLRLGTKASQKQSTTKRGGSRGNSGLGNPPRQQRLK